MPAEKHWPINLCSDNSNRVLQTSAVLSTVANGRPGRPLLPEWEIAAKNHIATVRKASCERNQQGRRAVSASAMRQHEAALVWNFSLMHKAANRRLERRIFEALY